MGRVAAERLGRLADEAVEVVRGLRAVPGAVTAGLQEATGSRDTDPHGLVHRIHELIRTATGVALPVRLWDRTQLGPHDTPWRLVLHHPWSLRTMLWPPSDLTAGQAYLTGQIDIEGDVLAMVADGERISEAVAADPDARLRLLPLVLRLPRAPHAHSRRARLRGRMHTQGRDREAVSHHYDLPPAFYETFLDADLVYSCAYFDEPDGDLDEAQRRKLDLVCRKLRLEPNQRLLDIGCGFGSLLIHAARHFGVEGVGVTLSRTQAEVAQRRVEEAGLPDRVTVELADYREVGGTFDAVASVGMVEHVGPDNLSTFFATAHERVRPGGMVLCHGIVLGDPDAVRRGDERTFVTAYVFPDGGLVPAWSLVRESQRADLDLLDVQQLRPHYAWTCAQWIRRLEANHDRVVAVAGEEVFRIWRVYLAGSSHSFAAGSLGVVQVLSRRPVPTTTLPHHAAPVGNADLPIGRGWMEPARTRERVR